MGAVVVIGILLLIYLVWLVRRMNMRARQVAEWRGERRDIRKDQAHRARERRGRD